MVLSSSHFRDCFAHFQARNMAVMANKKKKGFSKKNAKVPCSGITAYALIDSGGFDNLFGTTIAQLKNCPPNQVPQIITEATKKKCANFFLIY